jgi:hypothetical protein
MAKQSSGETTATQKGTQSRRSFLGKLGLGVAALAAVSAVPFLRPGQKAKSAGTPGKDSIFHPRNGSNG